MTAEEGHSRLAYCAACEGCQMQQLPAQVDAGPKLLYASSALAQLCAAGCIEVCKRVVTENDVVACVSRVTGEGDLGTSCKVNASMMMHHL